MQPTDQSDDLVIATPERVAFQYEIAGIGSRFLAQIVDMVIVSAIGLVIIIAAVAIGALLKSGQVAALVGLLLGFILLAGYFLISETVLSGQTIGKRSVRLRVVGDQGQPITLAQSAIRNLVRIIDFLPVLYGIGIVTLFISGRGKRLGDFAAGTLVVRDRERVSLYDLASTASGTGPVPGPQAAMPPPSIWAQPGETVSAGATLSTPQSAPVDPALRRLVVAYAGRREELPVARRQALALSAEPALRRVLPDLVASQGPLAALDQLAEREGVTPFRAVDRNARRAMTWGVVTLVFFWVPPVAIPTGLLSIIFARKGLRAIRREPARLQGEDRARTGRILGITGLAIASLLLALFALAFIFRTG